MLRNVEARGRWRLRRPTGPVICRNDPGRRSRWACCGEDLSCARSLLLSQLLAQYQREEITQVARVVEQKLEALVAEVTAEGRA
jgi:hypothetical protein